MNTNQTLALNGAVSAPPLRDTQRKSKKRKSVIISQLCELSKNGWQSAKPYDYEPLESELNTYSKP